VKAREHSSISLSLSISVNMNSMKKILIAEDNKDLQEIYKHSFEKDGYEVVLKNNGEEAFAVYKDGFTVILLDLMMPKINGFEFLEKMKADGGVNIPVIICSNISDIEMINKAIIGGASSVLLKVDYVGRQLVDKVNYLVEEFNKKKENTEEAA
jgi:CheY-like chemotaxis protein